MAIVLTEQQIQEWAGLMQQYNDARTWSNKDATVEEVAEIKVKFDAMGKGEQTEEHKQKQTELLDMLFAQVDTENVGSID